jgi:hypothetical protein
MSQRAPFQMPRTPHPAPMSIRAQDSGFDSFFEGLRVTDNPYPLGNLFEAWRTGWWLGHKYQIGIPRGKSAKTPA